jgi:3-oxoadipate enol-lactonase
MPRAQLNGLELYYEETRAAPHWIPDRTPVLFIHGLSTDHTIWEKQVAAFSKDRPVIVVDVRGHGRSAKPEANVYSIKQHADDMIALLRHLGGPKVHVVGVSMGGMAAQQMALRAPELLESIALICSSSEPPRQGSTLEWRLEVFDESRDLEGYIEKVFERALISSVSKEARDHLFQLSVHNSRSIQRTGIIETFSYDATRHLKNISIPTLVVGGKHDGSIPPVLSETLASAIPGAKLVMLSESGHAPYIEAPEELNVVLGDFFSKFERGQR